MSVETDIYIGFTVELCSKLDNDDFELYHNIIDKYPELDMGTSKVKLVIDGMNGYYARLIYIEKKIDDCYCDLDYFRVSHKIEMQDNIYNELNKYYKIITGKELSKDNIDYAMWAHWY